MYNYKTFKGYIERYEFQFPEKTNYAQNQRKGIADKKKNNKYGK